MHKQQSSATDSLNAEWKTKLGIAATWGIYYSARKRNETLSRATVIIHIPTPAKTESVSCTTPKLSKKQRVILNFCCCCLQLRRTEITGVVAM